MPCGPSSILVDANRIVQVTMQHPFNMSELSSNPGGRVDATDTRACGRCGKILIGLAILALARAGEAPAGEQTTFAVGPVNPDFGTPRQATPLAASSTPIPENFQPSAQSFQSIITPEIKTFSDKDFRPRGRSIFDKDPADSGDDAPMMNGTTAWQRLADYRSHNRVRLLTLWEDGGSSVSLQAGKRGDPSLQWTSRSMNRGGATRGLFDELFSFSLTNAGHGFKPAPRAQTSDLPAKPSKLDTAEVK
jgi:hypothetical protein